MPKALRPTFLPTSSLPASIAVSVAVALTLAACQAPVATNAVTAPSTSADAPTRVSTPAVPATFVPAADTAALGQRWAELRREQPRLMTRDAARQLGVSEAQLLATTAGATATRLRDGDEAARSMMRRVLDFGPILAVSRNEHAVIEATGVPRRNPLSDEMKKSTGDPEKDRERARRRRNFIEGYMGGPIDLRFGFDRWRTAFAVVQPGRDGKISHSLQFFDEQGDATLKVFLRNDDGVAAFDRLVADFRHPQQQAAVQVAPTPAPKPEKPDAAIDVKELQLAWSEMTDPNQFGRLVFEFGVTREQALRLAPPGTARRLAPRSSVRALLEGAAAQRIPLVINVANRGITQMFTGRIDKVAASGEWFNVLDPDFNLHLRDQAYARAWLVERAGVQAVEVYDDSGSLAVTFVCERERDQPQPAAWARLVESLPQG